LNLQKPPLTLSQRFQQTRLEQEARENSREAELKKHNPEVYEGYIKPFANHCIPSGTKRDELTELNASMGACPFEDPDSGDKMASMRACPLEDPESVDKVGLRQSQVASRQQLTVRAAGAVTHAQSEASKISIGTAGAGESAQGGTQETQYGHHHKVH
jgi:hypothetical protein